VHHVARQVLTLGVCVRACVCDVLCHGGAILSDDIYPFHSVLGGILVHIASSEQEREGRMSKGSIKHSSSERTALRWRDVPDDMVETHKRPPLCREKHKDDVKNWYNSS